MKQDAYIFDIDGTIADCCVRLKYIYNDVASLEMKENPEWDKFHAAAIEDTPIEPTIKVLQSLIDSGYTILFVTGRPETSNIETVKWLGNYIDDLWDSGHQLYMRKRFDRRQDAVIKKEIYELAIKDKYNVLGVFEDRQQCVDMWRELGLICYQVAKGDY